MATAPPSLPPIELDLRRLATRIWALRVRVVALSAAAFVIALGVAFLLPTWFRATVVMLPPDESDLLANISMAHRAMSKFPQLGTIGEYYTPADLFKATLSSRMAREHVADRFELQKVYKLKSREKTLLSLQGLTKVKLMPDGTIVLSVEDRDPRRAAAMANAYAEYLDRFNIDKRSTQGRRARVFLERRMRETDSLLIVDERTLRKYQEQHKTVAPTSLGSGDVASAADVLSRKLMLEVRLGVLRTYLRENDDQIVRARAELNQLEKQIRVLPTLETELTRLIRDYKVQEQLYLLLSAELEQARIQEVQDTPTVTVLDPAVPPERKSRPKRSLIALIAGALTFLGVAAVIAIQGDPETDRKAAA